MNPAAEPAPHYVVHGIGAQEAVSKDAMLEARKHVTELLRQGKWWDIRYWPQKIGVRLFQGAFEQHFQEKIQADMKKNNTSIVTYDDLGKTAAQLTEARAKGETERKAIVERFKMGQTALRQGEKLEDVASGTLKQHIVDQILKPIIQGTITTDDRVREVLSDFVKSHINDPQIEGLFGPKASDFGDFEEYFATDLLATGEQMRQDIARNRVRLDEIERHVDIKLGKAKVGEMTDARTNVDKAVAWAKRRRIKVLATGEKIVLGGSGAILNPLTVSVAVSLGSQGMLRAGGLAGRALQLTTLGVGSVAGGTMAGARRYFELGLDRKTQQIEAVYGEKIPTKAEIDAQFQGQGRFKKALARLAGAYRRADLAEFNYDVISAKTLIEGSGNDFSGNVRRNLDTLIQQLRSNPNDPAIRAEIARRICEIDTRMDLSVDTKTDLIKLSETGDRSEREITITRLKGKARDGRSALQTAGVGNVQNLIDTSKEDLIKFLAKDKKTQDTDFQWYRARQVAGAATFGAVAGATGAVIGQEGWALVQRASGHYVRETLMEAGIGAMAGHRISPGTPTMDAFMDYYANPANHPPIELGNKYSAVITPQHEVTIFDTATHNPVKGLDHISIDPNGHMTAIGDIDPAAQHELKNLGFDLKDAGVEAHTIIASTVGHTYETIKVNGKDVNVWMPKGDLPDNSHWKAVLRPEGPDKYEMVAVHDGGAMNGQPIQTAKGIQLVLGQHLSFDEHGALKPGYSLTNGSQLEKPISLGTHDIIGPPDPKNITDLAAGKEVFGSNGFSFKADTANGILHIYQNGREVGINDPANYLTGQVKIKLVDGKALIEYTAVDQNTDPTVLLKAIESTGTQIHNSDFSYSTGMQGRIADADWHTYLNGLGSNKMVVMADNLLPGESNHLGHAVTTVPPVPWPDTQTGEHFPFTAKPFAKFFEGGKFADARHVFMDGHVANENGREIIQWDNGAKTFAPHNVIAAYDKDNDWDFNIDKHWKWIIQRPGEEFTDGYKGAILSEGKIKAEVPDWLVGKVYASFGYLDDNGVFHKFGGFGPTETIKSTLNFGKIEHITDFEQQFGLPKSIIEDLPKTIIIPPEAVDAPIIVPSFSPRHPLDEVEGHRFRYYYAGLPSPEDRAMYASRRSPRLTNNPNAVLSEAEESSWYFSQQPPEYVADLERMNNLIGEPMSDECRVSVCIAAASHHEGKNIYNTLNQYLNQKDIHGNPLNQFEINLFLNRPDNSTPDATKSEVDRFKREHPELKVRVFEKTFPHRLPMGVISKYVADMALLRSSKRGHPANKDLIIANNDADADLISNSYISAVIRNYDDPDKKHIDGALGKIEWTPEAYIKFPGFHVANRFYQIIESGMRHNKKNRNIGSSGANFTIKSSMYAGLGGFNINSDLAQDVELSKMLLDARRPNNGNFTYDDYPIDYINAAWLVTSPRRGISTYLEGKPVVNQWDDFGSRQGQVRLVDWRTITSTETIDTLDISRLEREINSAIKVYGIGVHSDLTKRALRWLNIKYTVVNGVIKITDISKLKEELHKYKDQERNKSNERKNS